MNCDLQWRKSSFDYTCATRSCSFLGFVDTFAADSADSFERFVDSSSCFLDFDNFPAFPSETIFLKIGEELKLLDC